MPEHEAGPVRLGFVGCGRVASYYAAVADDLARGGLAEVVAGCDPSEAARLAFAERYPAGSLAEDYEAVVGAENVDAVLVLAPMLLHAPVARAALDAGKHVLVEKPLATDLDAGRALVDAAQRSRRLLLAAPFVILSGTYQAMWRLVREGTIGSVHLIRARYGNYGPSWAPWFYRSGGGALFDLGVYNLTSLTGFFGPARRVTALAGTAVPERTIEGEDVDVEAVDNAQILLDFGDDRYASVATGFTMRAYNSPAIELYGSGGVLQMLGDDWAPEGYEVWRPDVASWERTPAPDPDWHWADGLRHLVGSIRTGAEPLVRPEHALHVLEIMVRAEDAARDGRTLELETSFPPLALPAG